MKLGLHDITELPAGPLRTYCCLVVLRKVVVNVASDQTRFAPSNIPHDQYLEQVLVTLG
eukprot:SAG31_NODE_6259_length_2099_cov_1.561500_3_plen_58_part_01